MPKIRDGALDVHVGSCECVRKAWHLVDAAGDFHGAVYSQESADIMVRRLRAKGVVVAAVPKDVFTQALHVGEGA